MRKHNTAAKGRKRLKTPAEVLKLLLDGIEAVQLAKESGTTVGDVASARFREFAEAVKELELREALHILCGVGSFARSLAPFDTFPTKKVRFNVFPASMEKLARVAEARGTKTKKSSLDAVLEFLFNGLPLDYLNQKAEVAVLLSEHLPSAAHTTPVSLAMNGLWYALLQDLAELLGESQGAVLEAALELWLTDLRSVQAKTEKARTILNEFHSQAVDFYSQGMAVEEQLKEIFGGPSPEIFSDDPIYSNFSSMMVDLDNLLGAIESNMNKGVPIVPDDSSQQS